ncbi:hypothetical protein CALVIDRAFT_529541 [Calocera viscosa TUFC12733]|uniref:Zn(2)-C6 fungal-type domain-containing protein n=1 Tax=Calocera viscosa (strain TUFC12733) TaxID=1330018 RepID=A0A167J8P2_CALVF|nr:hypothetical protein CALVIDRAFT_529541 [Calocera viscosa TUFC12733]
MDLTLKRRALSPPPREPAPLRRRLAPLDISDNDHRALDELVMLRLDRYRAAQSFDAIKTLIALVKTCAELDASLTDIDAASRILDEREELEMLLMVGWEGREFKHVRNHPALRRKTTEREYSEVPFPSPSSSPPLPLTPPPQSVQARWESEASVDQGPLPALVPRTPDDPKSRPIEDYALPPPHAHHAHLPVQNHPHAPPDVREAQYYGPRLESEEPGPSRPKWSALPEHPSYHDEIDELEEDDAHMVYPSSYPMPAPTSAYAGPNRRRSYVPTSARAAQLEERASRSTGIVKVADARCKRCIARGIAECTIYKSTRTPNNGRVACHMCQKMKVKCEWERNPNETLSTAVRDVPPGIGEIRDVPGGMELRDPPVEPAPLGSQGQGYDSKPNRIWERDYEPRTVLPEQERSYPDTTGSASASASSFSTEGTPSLPYESEDMKQSTMVVPQPPMAQVQAQQGQGPVDLTSSPLQKAQKQRRAPKPPMTQVIRRVAVIKTGAARCDYCQKKKWDRCTISTTAMKACQACHRMKQRCQWSLSVGVGSDKGMTEEVKMELEEPVYAQYQPEDQLDSPDDDNSGSQENGYPPPGEYDDGAGYAPADGYEPVNGYAAPDNRDRDYVPSNGYSQPPGLGLSAPEPYPHSIASNQSYERGDTSTYTPHSRLMPLKESYERGRDLAPLHPRLPSNESYERGDTTLYSHSGPRDGGSGSGGYDRSESASYSDGISRPASSSRPPVMEQYPPKGMDQLLEPRPVSRQESNISNVSSSLSTPISSIGSQRVEEERMGRRAEERMDRREEPQLWTQVD